MPRTINSKIPKGYEDGESLQPAGQAKHAVSMPKNYFFSNNIIDFKFDAINIYSSSSKVKFSVGKEISSNSPHQGSHRDGIQIYPGKGIFAFTSSIKNIELHHVKIRSSKEHAKLQGVVGFDGVFLDIKLYNCDINTKHEIGIQFNGLLSGVFENIKIRAKGNRNLTLLPARLCGGNSQAIWLAEPITIGGKKHTYLAPSFNGTRDFHLLDLRKAFSKGLVLGETENNFLNYLRSGNIVFSDVDIDKLVKFVKTNKIDEVFNDKKNKDRQKKAFHLIRDYLAKNATFLYIK